MADAVMREPTSGGGAQETETRRPDLEDVLREDREQRDSSTEEHGEEIERDGSEQDVRPPDETNSREHLVEPDRRLRRRLAPASQRHHGDERDDCEHDRHHVDELRLDREEEPADRRSYDARELERHRSLRERADQDLLGHERRRQRTTGGRADRAPDALHEREREERPHVPRVDDRHREQSREDDEVQEHHHDEQVTPRKAIRQLPRR